ncbi:MAG: hypothetical protein R3B57_06385 [Phycisphaerales bacterium]
MPEQTGDNRPRSAWLAPAIVVALYLLVALPFILSGHEGGRGAWDSVQYHEPAIRQFAKELPSPDVSDYLSATTPGYHLILANVARWIDDSTMALQLAGAVFTVILLALLAWLADRDAGWGMGALLCLPMIASMYVLFPGIWLLPDNSAWLCVLGIIALALCRPPTDGSLLTAGLVLVALVLFRQIHIWAACVIWAHAWINAPCAEGVFDWHRVKRAFVGVLVTLPAFLVLALFAMLWGGLSPPTFQGKVQGVNLATPAFMLMEFAILSIPLIAFVLPRARAMDRRVWALAGGAFVLGLVIALVPETTWSTSAGRYSGWWNIIRSAPVVGGRTSVVVLALAPIGAALLTIWFACTPARTRWVLLAALAGFAAAQTASFNVWQRYHEPFLLMFLAIMASAILSSESPRPGGLVRLARVGGVLALTGLLALLTARSLIVGPEVEPEGGRADTARGEPTPDPGA